MGFHSARLQAPKSLLTLGAMLNEYICLKEQKVILDQERVHLEQEKVRVQTLLQGMQNVMSTYNASGRSPMPSISAAPVKVAAVAQSDPSESPAGTVLNLLGFINRCVFLRNWNIYWKNYQG